MTTRLSGVRLPTEVVLTPRLIAHISARFSNADIAQIIEALIDTLDARADDPDLEDDCGE